MINSRRDSGQTLILVMFMLIIMVIAGLFLFDLQSIIRGKIKSQSAVDSAALVGAEWQMHTLNMIGELNLIKASTALMTDYVQGSSPTYNAETFLDVRMADISDITLSRDMGTGVPKQTLRIDKTPLVSNNHGDTIDGFAPLYSESNDFGFDNQVYIQDSASDREWHWNSGGYPLLGKDLIYSMVSDDYDDISFTVRRAGIIYVIVQTDVGHTPYTQYADDNEGHRLTPDSPTLGPWKYINGGDIWMRYYESDGSRVRNSSNPDGYAKDDGLTIYRRYFDKTEVGKTITLTSNTNVVPILVTLEDVKKIPEGMKDELRATTFAADRLSNMQARIAFVGPLIGFGAAQQAAKNNGLPNNDDYSEVVRNQYNRLRWGSEYLESSGVHQYIPYIPEDGRVFPYDYQNWGAIGGDWKEPGYAWRVPYYKMLKPITDSGIAVAPNSRFLGIPHMDGDTWFTQRGYATDEDIYNAVLAEDWCVLRHILREDFSTAWWGEIETSDRVKFVEESEYFPVGVDFQTIAGTEFDPDHEDSILRFTNGLSESDDRGLVSLREQYDMGRPYNQDSVNDDRGTVGVYGDFVDYNDEDGDGKYDPLAYIGFCVFDKTWFSYPQDMIDDWRGYTDKDFVGGMAYWGGSVRVKSSLEPSMISGTLAKSKDSDPLNDDIYLGKELKKQFSDINIQKNSNGEMIGFDDVARDITNSERRMRHIQPKIKVSAAAKAFGRFNIDGAIYEPIVAGLVLPVFTDVGLIPVAMEDAGGLDPFNVDFYRWVTEGLPILGSYDNLGAASTALHMHPHWSSFAPFFGAIQKLNDPDFRLRGITWLETPTSVDDDGVVLRTNEDSCNWKSGHGGGGNPKGPSSLH